jgi:hypothetical protein
MGVEDKPNARGIEVPFRFEYIPQSGMATRRFYLYERMCKPVSIFFYQYS